MLLWFVWFCLLHEEFFIKEVFFLMSDAKLRIASELKYDSHRKVFYYLKITENLERVIHIDNINFYMYR